MFISSIANIGESLFFINIDNDSCYDSYASNPYADIAIFLFIRITSHYIFLISCLYIFKIEKPVQLDFEINSESPSSVKLATYYDDIYSESSLRSDKNGKSSKKP